MRLIGFLALLCAWATAAAASDKPLVEPAAAWVKPVTWVAGESSAPDAPIEILLQDQQAFLEPGRQTTYTQTVMRIQTPQGLAAGNISLPWRPETDVLTVHKLLIRRGGEVIDVLGSGQTFTVARREANLESAALDGVLTANIQPEGLQVGDILDFAASVSSSDPVYKGHIEQIAGGWNGVPIAHAHLRMQWPSSVPLRLRQSEGLPPLKPVQSGGTSSVELSLDDVEPLVVPKGAPARFGMGRLIEATDFRSWADLGALMAPLYKKAAVLPPQGPLQDEVARIKALSADPKVRTEAALALVQDRVRYVALLMGQGGLVPADAETTWSRRFGDCKGKTALLLALLHALEIQAEPVAVSTVFGDGMNERLPIIGLFNHVLVRAEIGGRTYWLDGTRTGDKRLDAIQVPAFGWGLPLLAKGGELVRMMPPPLDHPTTSVSIHMDARAGLRVPAPTKIETVVRGDEAVAMNMGLASIGGAARERALHDYWKEQYDFIDVKSTSATFDSATNELRLVMEGEARMDWSGGTFATIGSDVGYDADFSRHPGPNRDAPFAVPYPFYTRNVQTIMLPAGFSGSKSGDAGDVSETVAGIEYSRRATLLNNVFTVETTQRSIMPEFPAKDAPSAQAKLRELADSAVYVRIPKGYRPTDKELEAQLETTPTTAQAFIDRGLLLLDRQRFDEAISDFDRAHQLAPKNPWALANRGITRVWKGESEAAAADLDAAAAIDPRNPVVFRARGLLAMQNNDPAAAIAAFSNSLEIEPESVFALAHRAGAHNAAGDIDGALADAAAAIKLDRGSVSLYLLRANLFRRQGRTDEAIAEAAAVSAANPDNTYAHVVAARIYGSYGRQAEAMKEFDRALAISPDVLVYINRSETRPKEDMAGRLSDIEAALRLEAQSVEALMAKAELLDESGNHKAAIDSWTAAIAALPQDSELLTGRGISYALAGQSALADKDFAAARAAASEAGEFNSMCWAKATAGVALESALNDCDTALAKRPDFPPYLDSQAFVLLRLGRIDDAIAEYNRALAKQPKLSSSLFGRAVAWGRKGEKAKSEADVAAAMKVNPDVRSDYESYGIKL